MYPGMTFTAANHHLFLQSQVALKVLRLLNKSQQEKVVKRLKKEATVWLRLRHPNIAEFHGVCLVEDRPALVSSWYSNGTASQYLITQDVPTKLAIIKDIALGIQYLHSQNIVHGDIKGNNVLITADGTAVVTDFGLSRILEQNKEDTSSSLVQAGSARWLAAELFMNWTFGGTKSRSFETDIWALGCTVYELLTENIPYADLRTWFEISERVLAGGIPLLEADEVIHASPAIRELVCQCWNREPLGRPTIDQFVQRLPL
ncbi:kinase-like domain-containing protein [Mycena floridula]|nr:kinase-like domain-containing protein [Mycena floridula]